MMNVPLASHNDEVYV